MTRQRELDVGAGPLEGIHHRALGLELGGTEGDVEIERIGLLGVAQHDDRAADEAHDERLALELALELQLGLRLVAGLARCGRDGAVELELALGIPVAELAVGDFEPADQGRLEAVVGLYHLLGRSRCRRRLAQLPVQPILIALLDHDLRPAQHQAGQHQVALEQRPQADLEIDLFGLQHVGFLGPLGIGKGDAAQMYMRGEAPVDRDVRDRGLAARKHAGMALDAAPEIVRRDIKVHGPDRDRGEDHQRAGRPGQEPEKTGHTLGTVRPPVCSRAGHPPATTRSLAAAAPAAGH